MHQRWAQISARPHSASPLACLNPLCPLNQSSTQSTPSEPSEPSKPAALTFLGRLWILSYESTWYLSRMRSALFCGEGQVAAGGGVEQGGCSEEPKESSPAVPAHGRGSGRARAAAYTTHLQALDALLLRHALPRRGAALLAGRKKGAEGAGLAHTGRVWGRSGAAAFAVAVAPVLP